MCGSLGQAECEHGERTTAEPAQDPDGPRPALRLRGEAADEWAEHRAAHCRQAPQADDDRPIARGPHVDERRAAGGERGRADEAGEEAQRDERAEVLAERGGDLQQDEDEERDDVDGRAPDLRDLRERREEHGADAVADDEDREAERGGDVGYAEFHGDVAGAGRVDCGADVDAEGEDTYVEGDEALFQQRPLWRRSEYRNKVNDEKIRTFCGDSGSS